MNSDRLRTLAAVAMLVCSSLACGETTSTLLSRDGMTSSASPCSRADELRKKGERKKAIKAYQQALERDASLDRCRYHLGVLLFQEGRTEEALENLKRSVDAADNPAEAFNWLAQAKAEMGDESGAVELWRFALEKDPQFVEAHYRLALQLKKQGKTDEARKELQAALEKKPDYKPAKQALEKLGEK